MPKPRRICTECSCEDIEKVDEKRDEEGDLIMEMYCCKYCGMNLPEYYKSKKESRR